MMPIYYENSRSVKLNLLNRPYRMQTSDLFDYAWSYEGLAGTQYSGAITRFYKEICQKNITLSITAQDKASYYEAINHFFETTDCDVNAVNHGRIWVGEYYLRCYMLSSKKTEWEYGIESLDNDIVLVTDYPFWIKERYYSFEKSPETYGTGAFLDYSHDYPYDYAIDGLQKYIENPHYGSCDFEMNIFGPCVNPAVVIAGHIYEVITTVAEGEYLRVKSREGTVFKISQTGEQTTEYNNRNKDSSLFERIPPGENIVTWNGSFGFDITLFIERSEPEWIL